MFWHKPKCTLEVKQGDRGAWRWTARSAGNQTFDGVELIDRQVVGVDTIQVSPAEADARALRLLVMRGWKVVGTA